MWVIIIENRSTFMNNIPSFMKIICENLYTLFFIRNQSIRNKAKKTFRAKNLDAKKHFKKF